MKSKSIFAATLSLLVIIACCEHRSGFPPPAQNDVANIKNVLGVMASGRWYGKPMLKKMIE